MLLRSDVAGRQLVRREQTGNKNGALRDAAFQLQNPEQQEKKERKTGRKEVKQLKKPASQTLSSRLVVDQKPYVFVFSFIRLPVRCLKGVASNQPITAVSGGLFGKARLV